MHTTGSAAHTAHQGATKSRAHLSLPTGPPAHQITPAQRARAAVADIALSSPAAQHVSGFAGELPAKYTCGGQNTPPPLRWHGVPAGTRELELFVMSLKPVGGKLFFDWSVAGISPSLTRLEPGHLPAGAVVGRNGLGKTGYSICPTGGERERYVFALFAVPSRLAPQRGFEPAALRQRIVGEAHSAGLLILAN
jgi:phosphatidylethanolamine-binding protein (PEBP) family uncharacterized protein